METFTLTQSTPHAEKYYLYPSGDISGCTDWIAFPNTPDFECVNENKSTPNHNDYVWWNISQLGIELFEFENFSADAGVVNFVKLYGWAKCQPDTPLGGEQFFLVANPVASCVDWHDIYQSDDKNLVVGWKKYSYLWTKNPNTAAIWSIAEINSSAFGVKGKSVDINAEHVFTKDDGGTYHGVNCYENTYTVVAAGTHLYLYSMASTGELTLLDSATDSVSNTYHDAYIMKYNNKYYVLATMEGDGLAIYEITGGTNLLLKDTIDNGDIYRGLWYDENLEDIWIARSDAGVSVYSFDGTNLALVDTQDDGFCYDVHGTSPYIFAAMGVTGLQVYSVVAGNIIVKDAIDNGGTYTGVWSNGKTASGTNGTTVHCACDANSNSYKYISATDTLTQLSGWYISGGNYEHVWGSDLYVYYSCKAEGIKIFTFYASAYDHIQTLTTVAEFDGVGFNSIDGILIATGLGDGALTYLANSRQELYLSSLYLEVDYTSDTTTCTLNKPETISTNHNRNIKMFNFWNGSREVYDLNRSGKSIVLKGMEFEQGGICDVDCPCERITCIRDMAKNGAVVTLAGLGFAAFNGEYRITQFGWNETSERPQVYEWILSLQDADL